MVRNWSRWFGGDSSADEQSKVFRAPPKSESAARPNRIARPSRIERERANNEMPGEPTIMVYDAATARARKEKDRTALAEQRRALASLDVDDSTELLDLTDYDKEQALQQKRETKEAQEDYIVVRDRNRGKSNRDRQSQPQKGAPTIRGGPTPDNSRPYSQKF